MESFALQLKELDPQPSDDEKTKRNHLGQGSFGRVYRGVYLHQHVAVKLIHADVVKEAGKELKKECEILSQLHHTNIERLIAFSFTKELACMVVELAERGSLYDILKDKEKYPHISWSRRLTIAYEVACGLNCLHNRDPPILHRDLKSLNILLRQYWSTFIADFGLARIKATNQSLGTREVGSVPWRAPEMLDEKSILTTAIDIYSFGMIMYELLTRITPWSRERKDALAISRAVDRHERPRVPTNEKKYPSIMGCPKGYIHLMERCWAQSPEARPKLAEILAALLEFKKMVPADESLASIPSGTLLDSSLATFSPIQKSSTFHNRTPSSPIDLQREKSNLKRAYIAQFLTPLDCEEYIDTFFTNGYDSRKTLQHLTREECQRMQIKPGYIRIILDALPTLPEQSPMGLPLFPEEKKETKAPAEELLSDKSTASEGDSSRENSLTRSRSSSIHSSTGSQKASVNSSTTTTTTSSSSGGGLSGLLRSRTSLSKEKYIWTESPTFEYDFKFYSKKYTFVAVIRSHKDQLVVDFPALTAARKANIPAYTSKASKTGVLSSIRRLSLSYPAFIRLVTVDLKDTLSESVLKQQLIKDQFDVPSGLHKEIYYWDPFETAYVEMNSRRWKSYCDYLKGRS